MTPQLQQAIRLLQLSTLELQQELQQALESNPLLEQIDTHEEIDTRETQDSETLDTADAASSRQRCRKSCRSINLPSWDTEPMALHRWYTIRPCLRRRAMSVPVYQWLH